MRYRIKIKTFKNGRKEYTPQVKAFIGWYGIMYEGTTSITMFEQSSREDALMRIDKHFNGGGTKQSIEFEYIDRS